MRKEEVLGPNDEAWIARCRTLFTLKTEDQAGLKRELKEAALEVAGRDVTNPLRREIMQNRLGPNGLRRLNNELANTRPKQKLAKLPAR